MLEVVWVSDEINIHVGWGSNRLPTLSSSNNFFKLGTSRLDLTSCVLGFSDFLIWILFNKVIVSSKHCAPFIRKIGPLELLSLFDTFTVLFLLFLQISIVEARWLVKSDWLITSCNWWLHATQCTHQVQVIELIDIFTGKWCNRPVVRGLVELRCSLPVTRYLHQRVHSVSWCIHSSYRAFIRDTFRCIDLKSWHALLVLHPLWTTESKTLHARVRHHAGLTAITGASLAHWLVHTRLRWLIPCHMICHISSWFL